MEFEDNGVNVEWLEEDSEANVRLEAGRHEDNRISKWWAIFDNGGGLSAASLLGCCFGWHRSDCKALRLSQVNCVEDLKR